MLLRKQTAYDQSFGVTLDFNPSQVGYEAGIVLWWNQDSYATIGVTLIELPSGEKVQTVVRRMPTGSAGSSSVCISLFPFLFRPLHLVSYGRSARVPEMVWFLVYMFVQKIKSLCSS